MTKDEALRMAIPELEYLYGVTDIDRIKEVLDACKDALKNPSKNKQTKEPQYAYAWLNKEDSIINLEYEFDDWAVMEDPFYKYLGRIKLEVNND